VLSATLVFLGGVLTATQLPYLPSLLLVRLVSLGCLGVNWGLCYLINHYFQTISSLRAKLIKLIKGLTIFILGMSVFIEHVLGLLNNSLANEWLYKPIIVIGTVASVPESKPTHKRFEFLIEKAVNPDQPLLRPIKVLLSDYGKLHQPISNGPVKWGERWQLTIRLREPRSFWNPGSFDYQAWLYQRRIQATGTLLRPLLGARGVQSLIGEPILLPVQAAPWSLSHGLLGLRVKRHTDPKKISIK
jgi:predicted membrane metal-binding protein